MGLVKNPGHQQQQQQQQQQQPSLICPLIFTENIQVKR